MAPGEEVDVDVKEVKECCTARNVLWYLVFVGFAVNYMIRINLNIAIVSMIPPKPKNNVSLSSECIKPDLNQNFTNGSSIPSLDSQKDFELNVRKFSPNSTPVPNISPENRFDWNEKVQGYVLGSFFWLHWTTQVPGGLLASKYGTKLVFGLSNFAGVVFCVAIPFFARMGAMHLVTLRLVQGILCGFAWPSMHDMTAKWIPPNERSKFVTAYLGSSVGTAVTYPICGFIIDRWGWEYVFYASSAFGTIWFTAWWLLVHDSPSEHPRISQQEKEYIIKSLGQTVSKNRAPVPWRHILTNKTVWMNILTQWGGLWGLFTIMTHAPTYFKIIHGWNIKATGIFSGLPHLLRMMWAYVFSLIGDYLLRSNKMSRTNVRKLAAGICCIGQGVFMMLLAHSGCHTIAAIAYLTMAVAIHGSVSTGPLASVVDISPNYAGVILGLMNTAAAFVGFCTPAVVGYLTFQNQTTIQWQKVFWIASGMLFSTGGMYVMFAKSELQPWNSPDTVKEAPEEELMVIKAEKNGTEDLKQ